jgi:peptidoglycan/LPS O-acetylase OafA/YrhL
VGGESRFRPDIEGLRGIAILLVILYHAKVPGFTGGYVGVDVFFVLSGYLITGLIVDEITGTGTLSFRQFYARRARRLLPAAILVTLATLAVGHLLLAPLEQRQVAATALATTGYWSNLHFALQAMNYLAAETAQNPLLHTWSLAVEEQFYLVWPLLVFVAMRGGRKRLIIAMSVLGIVSLVASIWLTSVAQPWAFFSSPTRAWQFALGALATLLPAAWAAGRRSAVLLWGGLAAVVGAALAFDGSTPFPGAIALWPVVGTAAMLFAGSAGRVDPLSRLLASPPMQTLGRLSYGWYLWHWPALVYATVLLGTLHWGLALLVSVIALGLAELGYRILENPIRRSPMLLPRPVLTLVGAVLLTGTVLTLSGWSRTAAGRHMIDTQVEISLAANDWPKVYRGLNSNGCHLEFLEVESPPCDFAVTGSDSTVVLFGDSHAMQWFPAVERVAIGWNWRVVSLTKAACPSVDVVVQVEVLKRRYHECEQWQRETLKRIIAMRPAVVVMSNSRWYLTQVPADAWSAALQRTLSELSANDIPTLLIQDTPRPGFVVPTCLGRAAAAGVPPSVACGFPRMRPRDEVGTRLDRAVSAAVLGVSTIDLSREICGEDDLCDTMRDGKVLYVDHDHITATYAASFAPRLGPAIRDAMRIEPR